MNFWEERWSLGQTGWHNQAVNENLQRHHHVLFTEESPRILVPLCGKTLDMPWLSSQGATIVGVDLVAQALKEFINEHNLSVNETTDTLTHYTNDRWHLIQGNIFDTTAEQIGMVDAIFDRAALVALPLDSRTKYASHCLSLLKEGGKILLITYDSPVADNQGPPFPVRKGTVERLYAEATSCVQIDEIITHKADDQRLQKRNLDWSRADIWEITK